MKVDAYGTWHCGDRTTKVYTKPQTQQQKHSHNLAMKKPIYVTQPSLPPLEEFIPYLEKIWKSKILTNNGPFHKQLEEALCEYLDVEHVALFNNGTIALITALQALKIKGEVITTPYSFVATAHSLVWNNIEPVFVDIDPATCNLDPERIEEAITPRTTAILPVHCYGNPCNTERIQQIANTHGLKVIYDAAHAFGVKHKGESVLRHGDLSVLSFHATKVFNTFEGGAIICPNAEIKQRIDHLKNFGFADETTVMETGINGKMSEFNAALGLLQLKTIDNAIKRRRQTEARYRNALVNIPGITLLPDPADTIGNASYMPIMVNMEYPLSRDELYQKLKDAGINGRRYFHPLICDLPMYSKLVDENRTQLKSARTAAENIICLPIYPSLLNKQVDEVADLISSAEDSTGTTKTF
ncbi:dTDP-4-amino-4,6-dideoxy-D-glucose transaminase [Rubripirellula lacrimiformis]|uniref:dTDP-4-amino-4,6-dideoxy-D-glucose transaminase n=1 Tax=Rubripirellula lacrimiformis TaxID=1930273 RepID=A0A517N8S2_9BACT|nr:DegT/DnrJ/EryC1/StrS family aminotransferase [Rubripirellula lacrimiformis]QDT03535.1 dTDP-4-amino-4,6-dideoxy-D-glucose transaminase [Rubripirellula lacrimiformis]